MSASRPLPEGCYILMDMRRLPDKADGSDDLVPLSPLTINWGVAKPWDTPNPAVLTMTLLDQSGRYGKSARGLMGHRFTVRPDWSMHGIDNDNPVSFCVFDGYVTDAQIVAGNDGKNRVTITASDRLYLLAKDTRKGPNTGTDANAARGYQWWLQGTSNTVISNWLYYDGIPSWWFPYDCFSFPPSSDEKHSFVDFATRKQTRKINGKYNLEIDRLWYIGYQNADGSKVPQFNTFYGNWDVDVTLTGPSIVLADDGTDITSDYRTLPASHVIIDQNAALEGPDDYYTQLEIKYAHQGLTNPGATAEQQAQAATTYNFTQDGSRVVQIETMTINGETAFSAAIDWTEYPSNADSSVDGIDVSRAVNAIKESNRRVRLPELTFRNDLTTQMHMYTRPMLFLFPGSKYDRTVPATTGAWVTVGGTLTYDVAAPHSRWTHRVRVWPARNRRSGQPTCADMQRLTDTSPFSEATWELGALRYVTATGPAPAIAAITTDMPTPLDRATITETPEPERNATL